MSDKRVCGERHCDWRGTVGSVLTAPSPFSADTLQACPACKEVNSIRVACDEPGCWEEVSCGTPTPNGYRQTCGKHAPKV